MNWLDVVLAVLIGWSVAAGVWRGFTRLILGLAATLAGILLGLWFYGIPAAWLEQFLSSRRLANLLGFLLIFVGLQLAGAGFGWLLNKFWKSAGLSWVDRLLGGVFGLLRGVLIGIVLVMILTAFPVRPAPDSVSRSRLAPYLFEAAYVVSAMAPKELKDAFYEGYQRVKKLWEDAWREAAPAPRSGA
jgi:membrane protein required for colicin V production